MILKSLSINRKIEKNYLETICKDKSIYFYIFSVLLLSEFMVMRVYPFIGLADGFFRWKMTKELLQNGKIISDTVLSPIIPLLQAITYKWSESYALFTLLQTIFFYLCIGILAFFFSGKNCICIGRYKIPMWLIISFFILACPTVYIFPLLLTDSALCFCGLVIMAISFYYIYMNRNIFFWSFVICISTFFTVSLRVNTITVSLGLALLAFVIFKRFKKLLSGLLVAFTLLAVVFSNSLVDKTYHPETFGMIWELTSVVKNNNDDNLYSELKKIGDIDKAVEIYNNDFCNNIIWDDKPPFPGFVISQGSKANRIRKLYLDYLISNPKQFIKNKVYFMNRVLGVNIPLIDPARGINYIDDNAKIYGSIDTSMNSLVRTKFIEFTKKIGIITLRPYIMFLFSLLLLITSYFISKERTIKCLILYCISCLYYAGFLLNTQAHEFRYYAPSFFILAILNIYIIIYIGVIHIDKIYVKCRK